MIWIITVAWALMAVCTYFMFKKDLSKDSWTVTDRNLGLLLAITGPVGFITAIIVYTFRGSDKPAKW